MADWQVYDSMDAFKQNQDKSLHVTQDVESKLIDSFPNVFVENAFEENNLDLQIAPLERRFFAHVINAVVYWVLVLLLISILNEGTSWSWLALLMPKLIYLYTYARYSGNLGHAILGLKVVKKSTNEDFSNPGLGLLREIIKYFASFFVFPFFFLFFNKDKQNLYDLIIDTVVVEKPVVLKQSIKSDKEVRRVDETVVKANVKEETRYKK